ncbi:diguanylate cyclase [Desulfatitalea alkaliphila]|uniref:diguanylate cyclase n=1 Tax=Desulfatitalea alkaliphila TaxID=2929485 RepID=A0AA41URP0_9BACT|nr:diguanylate cyclase [Desulfatitalea alkaliphila]MCJ8502513.1 diguanylate cyclase [Desulfatitalea alkaliphila]
MPTDFPILVVDDDAVTRALITRYLKKAGFEVLGVVNGKEALAQLERQFCPIVLTDWMMPEIDGPALCRLIREKKTDRYVYILLITARDSKTDIVSGLHSGADDYLTKPIHSAELLARINTGIRILRLEQSLKQANDEIRLLSITDPLTGCFNRAYLNERLPREMERSRRYGHPLSVVIADIDHFKSVNDTHGHQAGDTVLRHFALDLRNQVRQDVDWVVRYGGEEFLIVLPETDLDGARIMAERARQVVCRNTVTCDDVELCITCSFGGATVHWGRHGDADVSMDQLINAADRQLYLCKEKGRDRVSVASAVPGNPPAPSVSTTGS